MHVPLKRTQAVKFGAIIINDELKCISNLKYFLDTYCPAIDVIGTGNSISEFLRFTTQDFDVAFLDIEIEKDNIFQFLSHTKHADFDIVFVTAYERYALDAFDVDVLDYVLKPLSKKEIVKCYNKIQRRFQVQVTAIPQKSIAQPMPNNIILKQGKHVYVVSYKDIVFFEAKGTYTNVCFYSDNNRLIVTISKSLQNIETAYPLNTFVRIHRSFLINTMNMKNIFRKDKIFVTMTTGDIIPIAKRRISEFLSTVKLPS